MFSLTDVIINTCIERLEAGYRNTYGNIQPDYTDLIRSIAYMVLDNIATSNALYHDVEHTVLVTLVGQEILRGKQVRYGNVSPEDWLHVIIALLCHDIGYVKGTCDRDNISGKIYDKGIDGEIISLPEGSTDASFTPYHVDRGKQFIEEKFSGHQLINVESIKHYIELTRFPVPKDDAHQDTANYPGLVRAADLIGQLSDPHYLEKLPALFYEFEETGMNKILGNHHPQDLRASYPNFFWNVVYPYIQEGLQYLQMTKEGKQIITYLYHNVLVVELENFDNQSKEVIPDEIAFPSFRGMIGKHAKPNIYEKPKVVSQKIKSIPILFFPQKIRRNRKIKTKLCSFE
ncbi:MAG TPA: Npun_R2479 family HD domain-containing metalloprotein [Leptolyngbyaceae cyanobacterium]